MLYEPCFGIRCAGKGCGAFWLRQLRENERVRVAAFNLSYCITTAKSCDQPNALAAPQATLMASVAQGVFGAGLPWGMVASGAVIPTTGINSAETSCMYMLHLPRRMPVQNGAVEEGASCDHKPPTQWDEHPSHDTRGHAPSITSRGL